MILGVLIFLTTAWAQVPCELTPHDRPKADTADLKTVVINGKPYDARNRRTFAKRLRKCGAAEAAESFEKWRYNRRWVNGLGGVTIWSIGITSPLMIFPGFMALHHKNKMLDSIREMDVLEPWYAGLREQWPTSLPSNRMELYHLDLCMDSQVHELPDACSQVAVFKEISSDLPSAKSILRKACKGPTPSREACLRLARINSLSGEKASEYVAAWELCENGECFEIEDFQIETPLILPIDPASVSGGEHQITSLLPGEQLIVDSGLVSIGTSYLELNSQSVGLIPLLDKNRPTPAQVCGNAEWENAAPAIKSKVESLCRANGDGQSCRVHKWAGAVETFDCDRYRRRLAAGKERREQKAMQRYNDCLTKNEAYIREYRRTCAGRDFMTGTFRDYNCQDKAVFMSLCE